MSIKTKASLSTTRRRTGLSASNLNDFVSGDAVFMQKISRALETVHENYGYKAIQDCLTTNEESGEAEVDLDILCAMMDRSQAKLKGECCAMFFASKGIIGSFMYLFGSILFGAVTYFNDTISDTAKAACGVLATSCYLAGGILFIIAAIEPYWHKTLEINAVSKEVYELKTRGDIVKKLNRKRNSDNMIKARISKFEIDTKSLLTPDEAELAKQKNGKHSESSSDIFESVAETLSPIDAIEEDEDDEEEEEEQQNINEIEANDIQLEI